MSKAKTTLVQHVAYVPECVDHALVRAQHLATSLCASAPALRALPKVKFASLQPIERKILKDCEAKAAAAKARINVHLSKIDQLFSIVHSSIKLDSKLLKHITLSDWNPTNALLATRVIQLQDLSKSEHAKVKALIAELGLDPLLFFEDKPVRPHDVFEACVSKTKYLQEAWQKAYFAAIDQALNLQNLYVRGSAAECLGQICKFALSNSLELDPPPQAQEDVFVALKDSLRNPLSGAWPKIITIAQAALAVDRPNVGGAV
jgi:hypothetical protein